MHTLTGLMDKVAEKPAPTDKSQESWEFSESESRSDHEKKSDGETRCVQNLWKFREFKSWKQEVTT